jgi:ADP-heptose:LPS heptosyltransferase
LRSKAEVRSGGQRESRHRITVLRALKLGDFLTGVPALRAIRRAFPLSRIVLAAPRELAPLAALLGNAIDEIAHSRELEALAPAARDCDLGIDLHGKGPESQRLLLQARARRLVSFEHPDVPESVGGAIHDPAEHEVARWCRMLTHAGIPADPAELDLPRPAAVVPAFARGATLIHPGAASEARCWPVERWVAVARAELRAGRRVVLTGGPGEVGRARVIARATGLDARCVFAGRTDLLQLAALVAAAERVVCADTGVAHLATAFRRPSVVLFGPTPPSTWGPPGRPYHTALWTGTRGDPHAARVDAGLLAISVRDVVAALERLPAA